jgi:hypothetical protein
VTGNVRTNCSSEATHGLTAAEPGHLCPCGPLALSQHRNSRVCRSDAECVQMVWRSSAQRALLSVNLCYAAACLPARPGRTGSAPPCVDLGVRGRTTRNSIPSVRSDEKADGRVLRQACLLRSSSRRRVRRPVASHPGWHHRIGPYPGPRRRGAGHGRGIARTSLLRVGYQARTTHPEDVFTSRTAKRPTRVPGPSLARLRS